MASDIHIYIQDAYQEARNLRVVADEVESSRRDLEARAEELASVWRGASARRVEAALLGRSATAGKLADNLNIIADGLYRTAQTYENMQTGGGVSPSAPSAPSGNTGSAAGSDPDVTINVAYVRVR